MLHVQIKKHTHLVVSVYLCFTWSIAEYPGRNTKFLINAWDKHSGISKTLVGNRKTL